MLDKRLRTLAAVLTLAVYHEVEGLVRKLNNGSEDGVIISIDYAGEWSGGYGDGSRNRTCSGHGPHQVTIKRMPNEKWTVYAFVAKKDDSEDIMAISISTPSGRTLARSKTKRIHGQLMIGWSADRDENNWTSREL